jgi:hypothetical protein
MEAGNRAYIATCIVPQLEVEEARSCLDDIFTYSELYRGRVGL